MCFKPLIVIVPSAFLITVFKRPVSGLVSEFPGAPTATGISISNEHDDFLTSSLEFSTKSDMHIKVPGSPPVGIGSVSVFVNSAGSIALFVTAVGSFGSGVISRLIALPGAATVPGGNLNVNS